MNYGFGDWVLLFVSIVIAILGLLLAAKAADSAMSLAGWLFFAFGTGFAFRLAGRMAIRPDEQRNRLPDRASH